MTIRTTTRTALIGRFMQSETSTSSVCFWLPYYGYIRQQEMSTKSPHEIFNERFDDDHHLRVSGQN